MTELLTLATVAGERNHSVFDALRVSKLDNHCGGKLMLKINR